MSSAVDVIIVGGGPAGASAAIWSAACGLQVTLMERRIFPRHRPGESLHPGLESLFRQLGVQDHVAAASAIRHQGISVDWGGRRSTKAYGGEGQGIWSGYQILREDLDSILLARAREMGVEVIQPGRAERPIVHGGRVVGVRSSGCDKYAPFVVDAGGGAGWLRRHLKLRVRAASRPLRAYYGYCEGALESLAYGPSLVGNKQGWSWTAQIAPAVVHWTRLALEPDVEVATPPPLLAKSRQLDCIRGADVTWRHVPASAGPGYFLTGEAATVVDPAASHGVLRALMSGMMASHLILRICSGRMTEAEAVASYKRWIAAWFQHDIQHLSNLYRVLDPRWSPVPNDAAQPDLRSPDWLAAPGDYWSLAGGSSPVMGTTGHPRLVG